MVVLLVLMPTSLFAKKKFVDWQSPEGWKVFYATQVSDDKIDKIRAARNVPGAKLIIGQMYLLMTDEPGDYHFFGILMPKKMELLFAPQSRFVIRLKNKKTFTSEGIFFTESESSPYLWDTRKGNVLVSYQRMMTKGTNPKIVVLAKFSKGSFLPAEAESLTVEGVKVIQEEVSLK
ncbi:MAG: hypothetical protein QME66_12075 [Candidatus Eisenbacteria bacterium]|nr:hypothetical protein [Candidatus Eisenbacteria bacterium]